mgnify:CR=1 FL=1
MEASFDWEWFIKKFELISKIDLTAYKRPQMERRINSFMRTANVADYRQFIEALQNDRVVYRKFLEHITINVSEFFRNASHWDTLAKEIIPMLQRGRNGLKVWSAGCSTGEEAYSLAMLARDNHFPLCERILATDIDNEVLERAGAGLYASKALQSMSAHYLNRYFGREDEYYRISDEVKKMVRFEHHDLLRDPFGRGFDLILCRNVVIYFTEETKQRLYRRFAEALRSGGILFIGSTEQIFQSRELGLQSVATFFYQKV